MVLFARGDQKGRLPGIWWDPARLLKEFLAGDWPSVRSYCVCPSMQRHAKGPSGRDCGEGVEGRGELSNSSSTNAIALYLAEAGVARH